LTLDLPANRQASQPEHPKSGSRHFNALSSRRSPTPQNPQIPPETRNSQTLSASRNAQATGPMNQPSPAQDRRPRIPSHKPQCQTTTPVRPKTREPPSPFAGPGDPLRPVGACRQSKERCRNLHGPAFAGGCRLTTAEGPI